MIWAQKDGHEEDIPTEQPEAAPDTRFSRPDAAPGRKGRPAKAAAQGAQAPRCLNPRPHRFPPAFRVRKSTEFRRIYDEGGKIVRRGFVLFYLPNGTPDHRLGVTVTRRIGRAVFRNRCKRRIREAFRKNRQDLGPVGIDCVVHARSAIGTLTGREVEEEFRRCGARIRQELERG